VGLSRGHGWMYVSQRTSHMFLSIYRDPVPVFALLDVLFIARPESIFSRSSTFDPAVEDATPAQRLVAVGGTFFVPHTVVPFSAVKNAIF
jgi:hypothetical protein